jgi:hypothetical protein
VSEEFEYIKKYSRVGYINLGRPVDNLVDHFVSYLPPAVGKLPLRWKHFSVEQFLTTYGHLGDTLLAASANSHTVVCRGVKAARMWTDVANSSKIQIADPVVSLLPDSFEVSKIPVSNVRKSSGFSYQVRISMPIEAKIIALLVREVYGV